MTETHHEPLFECVPNVSEGRDLAIVEACRAAIEAAGARVAHATSDAVHDRSVLTYFGDAATIVRAAAGLAAVTTARIDLRSKRGAHPRIGALDVLPVVPVAGATLAEAARVARSCGIAIFERCGVPSLFYGAAATSPAREQLPDVRRGEFEGLAARAAEGERPDAGTSLSHPSAGTVAVGAREVLVAFNIVLASGDLALARRIARTIRESGGGLRTLRAIGIALGPERVQVSCNLTDYAATPIPVVVRMVRALAAQAGVAVAGCETIGLIPRAALQAVVDEALFAP